MAIISLIDKLCMDNQSYTDLYNLLIGILDKMDDQALNTELLFIYFLLHLNKYIGYEININALLVDKDMNDKKDEDEIIKYLMGSINNLNMIDLGKIFFNF